jgi:hypothetical protein
MPPNRISILVALGGSDEGLKCGPDIPISLLVRTVVVMKGMVAARVPRLAGVIENKLQGVQ